MKLPNIFLVGPMGAGKSSIGRHVSQLTGHQFFDSDHEIEARTGANIPWIFDVEGEQGFRDREEAMIDELTQETNIILATGGGCVQREKNRANLMARGTVVFLQTSVEEQMARTNRDKNRPLLQTENPEEKLRELLTKRLPLYQEVADVTVITDKRNVKEVANEIVEKVQSLIK